MSAILPPLRWRESPNQSGRLGSSAPFLVVVHRPVASYTSASNTFLDPRAQVSAHVLTDGARGATQFVAWDRKAWACEAFNSTSYNLEVDDAAWTGADPAGLETAARIVAFICHKTGIPPSWSNQPTHTPGVVRHYDLGLAGGGHTDPTTDVQVWRAFVDKVRREYDRGGFRPTWGNGTFRRIDTQL